MFGKPSHGWSQAGLFGTIRGGGDCWRLEVGGWRLEVGGSGLEVGGCRLEAVGSGLELRGRTFNKTLHGWSHAGLFGTIRGGFVGGWSLEVGGLRVVVRG